MIKTLLIFVLVFFPRLITMPTSPHLIIWNVGQGAWFTFDRKESCIHIDMGGSIKNFPTPCPNKSNSLFITHYDLDHISIAPLQAPKTHLCLMDKPPSQISPFKLKMLAQIPHCLNDSTPSVQRLFRSQFQKKNESHVYLVAQTFLITGDADKNMERRWFQSKLPAHFLLLGHHGSRTSTSEHLLNHLPYLQMAFVSAMKKKYGHPHSEVLKRLKKRRIPVITTEDFGNIAIELPNR